MTRIALGIVWLFLFCHIWRLIPNIYELAIQSQAAPREEPDWLLHMIGLSHTLIVFNSAVNFLLYTIL